MTDNDVFTFSINLQHLACSHRPTLFSTRPRLCYNWWFAYWA